MNTIEDLIGMIATEAIEGTRDSPAEPKLISDNIPPLKYALRLEYNPATECYDWKD
ncbi:MAG: hypothetical protein WCK29_02740 [archaeon]